MYIQYLYFKNNGKILDRNKSLFILFFIIDKIYFRKLCIFIIPHNF